MANYFQKVKDYLLELDLDIIQEDPEDEVLVIRDEDSGISNLVIGCAEPILIMEQFILEIGTETTEIFKKLLQRNREIVHGAFVLDETGKKIIFRDTLEIENLDFNELEGSINSLSLLLSEFSEELLEIAHKK